MSQFRNTLLAVLIFVVPLLPLIFISLDHTRKSEETIAFIEKEIHGTNHISILVKLLKKTENPLLSPQDEIEINHRLNQVRKDVLEKMVYGRSEKLHEIRELLTHISFQSEREIHFPIVIKLIQLIADHSNLILDGELDSYYLMDAFVMKYIRITEMNEFLSHEKRSTESHSLVKKEFEKELSALFKSVERSKDYFQKSQNEGISFQNIDFISSLFQQSDNYHQLFEKIESDFSQAGLNLLNQILKARHGRLIAAQNLTQHTLFALVVLSFMVSGGILISLLKTKSFFQNTINEKQKTIEKGLRLATAGEVFASIAHDIATPLQVILLSADLIIDQSNKNNLPSVVKLSAAKIKKMTSQSQSIVKNMKALLKDSSEKNFEEFELDSLMVDLKDLTLHKAARHNVQIEIKNDIGNQKLFSNPYALLQILTNIVNNAVDAMREQATQKNIQIQISLGETNLNFDIIDNGPGVPKALKDKIFDSLFTTKQESGGTGLGLTISRKLAEKINGNLILVESYHGAHFQVQLPKSSLLS